MPTAQIGKRSDLKFKTRPDAAKHEIPEIDPDNEKDLTTITRLHLELLWWGPIARLGELFLREFCYTILFREGLMKAALYEVDGQPAGFVAYTDHSITFHRLAINKHWGYVAYLAIRSFIRDPRVIFRLIKAIWLMLSRRREKELGTDPSVEIIAIDVLV